MEHLNPKQEAEREALRARNIIPFVLISVSIMLTICVIVMAIIAWTTGYSAGQFVFVLLGR